MTQHELLLIDLIVLASEKVLRVGGSVALAVLGYLHISARLLAKSDLLVGVVSICLLPGKTGKAFNCWQGQMTGRATLSSLFLHSPVDFPGFPLASLCFCGTLCHWPCRSLLKAEEQLLNASQKGTLADKLRVSRSNLALIQKHKIVIDCPWPSHSLLDTQSQKIFGV